MIFRLKALGKHAIFINLYWMPNLLNKHNIYQPLIDGPSVLESKGNNFVAIETSISDEGSLLLSSS